MNPVSNNQTIVVDTSFVIALSDTTNFHHQLAVQKYENYINDNIHLLCNTITFAEFATGVLRVNKSVPQVFLREFLITSIPDNVWEKIAQIRINTGLKMPDCIVLWRAEYSQAQDIATFDQRQYQKFL